MSFKYTVIPLTDSQINTMPINEYGDYQNILVSVHQSKDAIQRALQRPYFWIRKRMTREVTYELNDHLRTQAKNIARDSGLYEPDSLWTRCDQAITGILKSTKERVLVAFIEDMMEQDGTPKPEPLKNTLRQVRGSDEW